MTKIGLALGSGGVRGLAHIGVLQVLEREGVHIDYIGGSSIGAIIGALYASGKTVAEIEHLAKTIDWRELLKLADPVLARGLFRGNKLKKFLAEHIDAETFADLKIPMSIVATDIQTGEMLEITEGNVIDAIRASISMPFVFTPVKLNGYLCADAGLSQPVPVSAVKNLGAQKVIAVDLDSVFFKKNKRGKIIKIDSTALNTINLMRFHLAKCNTRDADIVVTPMTGRIYWNKFTDSEGVIKAGVVATEEYIKLLHTW